MRLGRLAGRSAAPDDDQAVREDRAAMEVEHGKTLHLAKALAMTGKAIDLREFAKQTGSQSTCFTYA